MQSVQSLFPQGPGARSQILPQIEFKAGKCTLSPQTDGSFLVTPDVKKGLISILRGNDGVTHFRWIDRASSAVVDDYVVTRDDVVFKAVNTGRSADRVFILKWKNSNNRHMFWMQHKNGSDDPAIVTKVNDCINTPPPQQAAADWMNMLRGGRPAQAQAAPARPQPVATPNNLLGGLDLQSIIQNISNTHAANRGEPLPANNLNNAFSAVAPTASDGTSVTASSAGAMSDPSPPGGTRPLLSADQFARLLRGENIGPARTPAQTDLNTVITADTIMSSGVLDDPAVVQALVQYLPEGQQDMEGLIENIHSPQLQQAISSLSEALNSNSFNAIMANLGLDPSPGVAALMRGDMVSAFLACVNASADVRRQHASASSDAPPMSNPNDDDGGDQQQGQGGASDSNMDVEE